MDPDTQGSPSPNHSLCSYSPQSSVIKIYYKFMRSRFLSTHPTFHLVIKMLLNLLPTFPAGPSLTEAACLWLLSNCTCYHQFTTGTAGMLPWNTHVLPLFHLSLLLVRLWNLKTNTILYTFPLTLNTFKICVIDMECTSWCCWLPKAKVEAIKRCYLGKILASTLSTNISLKGLSK